MSPAQRLADVRTEIARAEKNAGREAGASTLIAVSKTHSAEEFAPLIAERQALLDSGLRDPFGIVMEEVKSDGILPL